MVAAAAWLPAHGVQGTGRALGDVLLGYRKARRPRRRRASHPEWRVIERITTACVLAAAGEEHAAARMLTTAAGQAETLRLPHQVQRIIRVTAQPGALPGTESLRAQATEALSRLRQQLSEASPA